MGAIAAKRAGRARSSRRSNDTARTPSKETATSACNYAFSGQGRLPRLLVRRTPVLRVVKSQYAVRCLSKFLIGLPLEDNAQYGRSPRVLGLIAERVYSFPPHLGALVAASRDLCKELDEVDVERRCLAPHAAKRVYGEAT